MVIQLTSTCPPPFLYRIYHTFIEDGSPWFVDLKSKPIISQRIRLMDWQNFNAKQLIGIFEEAEAEIEDFLVCIDISMTSFFVP